MIIFFVCFTSNQYKSNQISELSAGQLPFFKRPKKEKEMGMSKMGWGGGLKRAEGTLQLSLSFPNVLRARCSLWKAFGKIGNAHIHTFHFSSSLFASFFPLSFFCSLLQTLYTSPSLYLSPWASPFRRGNSSWGGFCATVSEPSLPPSAACCPCLTCKHTVYQSYPCPSANLS